ncbi:Zinc finger E-box-binding homeobox 1 [Melia azedarach]|uniref:Zinc finger E-box-binding homeobox 1 n=1 Tax=Melia azedarach TaxID=155640 RepID=A0ACC1XI28_MELAZ|nr:Zinc finger E-box-binding homeobox 1 [Melia azedarach]
MDLGKSVGKLLAMKNQKKGYFIYNLMIYSLTGLACSLFCCYPYWFSSLSCSIKQFLFIHFPYIFSSFCNPKWLFIIANVIIVFLVGESNLMSSSANSSPANDFYDEYVERCRRIRGTASTFPEKKEEKKPHERQRVDEVKEVIKAKEASVEGEEEKERDGEEEAGLPTEELNKRVEEFIARVNKQRWLEARSLVCCKA